MKDTLLYILTHIVDHPEAIEIVEQTDNERIIYLLTVAQEDMGKVIGKQGRIIRALRDLVKLMAAKEHTYVDIVLKEDEPIAQPTS
ncbi:MAG: hypothetical protein UU25_C0001G0024 [Microgenomates group bacterium GW2011_GWB1_40_9]|nr:MAG: hypothetical protein UT26_C0005G0013 [Microgenomates group bacterium GW2011_GWC1_39_12]KKR80113.1 MAG: hypothetical protein UU25_C0001G0024 [Microgenomates group bacterium GW2011_GWB1_40_9]